MGKDKNIWDYLEKSVIGSAERLRKSILKTCSDLGSKSKVVVGENVETYAKILVHAIFFECFLIRNELFALGQNGQQANRAVESLLFRSLDSYFPDFFFPDGGVTELTRYGMGFLDHLAGAKDMVSRDPFADCVVRRFVTAINEILGESKYSPAGMMLCTTTAVHLLAGAKAQVYLEIAKLLANKSVPQRVP